MLTYSFLSAGNVANTYKSTPCINTITLTVNPMKISTLTSLSFKELGCECEHYRTGCHSNPNQVFKIRGIYIVITL
jgi:hypothetical protein